MYYLHCYSHLVQPTYLLDPEVHPNLEIQAFLKQNWYPATYSRLTKRWVDPKLSKMGTRSCDSEILVLLPSHPILTTWDDWGNNLASRVTLGYEHLLYNPLWQSPKWLEIFEEKKKNPFLSLLGLLAAQWPGLCIWSQFLLEIGL